MVNIMKTHYTSNFAFRFAFLFLDYKDNAFYWEFVRLFVKTSLIILINVFDYIYVVRGIIILQEYLNSSSEIFLNKK